MCKKSVVAVFAAFRGFAALDLLPRKKWQLVNVNYGFTTVSIFLSNFNIDILLLDISNASD